MATPKARRTSPLNLPTAFQLFTPSKELVKKHIWIFGPLYFIPLLFSLHAWVWTPAPTAHEGRQWWHDYSWFGSGFSASSVPSYMWYTIVGFSIFWFLTVVIVGTITQIMSQEAQLEASQGRANITFNHLWSVVKELGWRMVCLYLLVGLYIVVGLILLVIPGLIMLRRYFLSPYVMLDRRCGIKEAMDRSADITKPMSGAIWGVIGVMFLISLLNIIPVIGWLAAFVLGAAYSVAPALRYQQLKKLANG